MWDFCPCGPEGESMELKRVIPESSDLMKFSLLDSGLAWTLSSCLLPDFSLLERECLFLCLSHLYVFSSVQFSHSGMSDSLQPHESQHSRPPCPSPTPGIYSNSCPLSQWCHPAISSSVVPFSSCPQSLQAPGSFPMSQLFTWGGQSIGVSASTSVLPMNTKD